jgi:AcrR family transcriptional regulator
MSDARPLRADAQRNRARILQAAFEAFASEGLGVSVHEIARRAGVGTGTVSRHFPTKESLYEAVVLSRAGWLTEQAARLACSDDPGAAFFEFFALVVAEGAANRGMADALAGACFDLDAATRREGFDVTRALGDLLARAQRAGAVRSDADAADVKAVITGCLARTPLEDPAAQDRMISIATQGLASSLPAGDELASADTAAVLTDGSGASRAPATAGRPTRRRFRRARPTGASARP